MTVFASGIHRKFTPYIPMLVYVVIAVLIALAGFQGFRKIENLIEVEKLNDLGSIADLKIGQVVSWQESQRRRAEVFLNGSSLLPAEFEQWLHEGKPSNGREQKILRLLAGLQHISGYKVVTLLDGQGVARMSTGNGGALEADDVKLALRAMNSRQVWFSDLHRRGDVSGEISIVLAAPLTVVDAKQARSVGAILLHIDPRDFLYPLIQSWPSSSPSAETLLTRQEGSEVVFLNELRHRKGAALSLRIPLDTPNLPTVMAIRGETSTKNGVDYRGVPVVAAMRRVPGTSWFMISKVDKDELFAPINQIQKLTAGLGLAFVVFGGFFFFVWLQGVQARQKLLKAEHEAALARELRVKHFEYLTRYANDMIIVANEAGQIVEANESAQQALGYSREELLHKRIVELHGPLDSPTIPGKIEMLKQEGALRVEGIYQRKDGSTFPVEISARVIVVQDTCYLQGIIRDITERKRAEAELRESEARFRNMADTALALIWLSDTENLGTWFSKGWLEYTGRTMEQELGRGWAASVHPDDLPWCVPHCNEAFKARRKFEMEIRLRRADGSYGWIADTGIPRFTPDGEFEGYIGYCWDITERKRAEEELRCQRNFIYQIVDADPNLISVKDADGKFLLVNQAMAALHGMRPDELVGRTVALFPFKEQAEQHLITDPEIIEARRQVESVTHDFLNGRERWFHVTRVPMEQPDGTVHVLSIGVDITEHKQFEELRAKMEHAGRLNVAGEMASGMAHELSQPLTACANYLDGCLRRMDGNDWDRESLHRAVQLAHKQAERAGKIISHLKDLVRKQGHDRALIDINLLVRVAMNFLEDEIKRQGISLTMTLFPLPRVMACRVEIEQVLLNLYKNAIESMYSCPQRELRVSTRTTESGDVLVAVSDTGRGVFPAEMEGLFNPFQTSKKDGLGLGLAICRTFIENHGGRIWADPQREWGAEFYFTLPVGGTHE